MIQNNPGIEEINRHLFSIIMFTCPTLILLPLSHQKSQFLDKNNIRILRYIRRKQTIYLIFVRSVFKKKLGWEFSVLFVASKENGVIGESLESKASESQSGPRLF